MKIISYFEALNLYIKVPSKRSGKTEEIIEAYFPKDSSSSIVFSNDGIEIYKIPHTNHNKRTRDVGVQTADRPYSPVTSINRNLTGHSVAWRNNPNIIQQQQQYHASNNKNGWNDVDTILDNAKSSLNTLGKQDQVGNYSAMYDNDQIEKHRPPERIEYGKHIIIDPDMKTRNIILWLNHLQITKAGHPDDWDRNFSNGYLLGEILQWYYPVDIQLSLFQANFTSAAKRHNWNIINALIKKRKLPLSGDEIKDLTNAVPLSCITVLGHLHDVLNDGNSSSNNINNSGSSRQTKFRSIPSSSAAFNRSRNNNNTKKKKNASVGLWEQQQKQMVARTEKYIQGT